MGSMLEKRLSNQIKERKKGDASHNRKLFTDGGILTKTDAISADTTSDGWQKVHLSHATSLVNLHIRNDIMGDVTTEGAIEHMKGDVCQMQIVESVWSIHDFMAAKKRACVKARMAKLEGDVTRCFEGADKYAVLSKTKNLADHFDKNEDADFDADFDALIKVILDLSVQTHESPNVAPAYCAESGMVSTLKSMADAVGICKDKAETCKSQLSMLEKRLSNQIKERKKGDASHNRKLFTDGGILTKTDAISADTTSDGWQKVHLSH